MNRLLGIGVLCCIFTAALAAEIVPVEIEAEKLAVEHTKNQVEFSGAVHLQRDDFELYCDRLVAHYQQGRARLERAEAYGHVRIRNGDAHGSSREARLDQTRGILMLIGDAVMEQPGGKVQGEEIEHDINRAYTEVRKGKEGRVRMFIESDTDQAGLLPGDKQGGEAAAQQEESP
ncbi:MAG: LptA/OstA family protein [Mariprofundaceae bacterium]